ncbi:hypothetical protein F5884DRAFT_208921 [Xylogone sp. PMI_703]|nr:hypothetical protein F5884DRAFT_208921 [Xylogone sp. PMI_703]
MLSLHSLPFYIHILIETPASLSFLLNPSSQLPPSTHYQPQSQSQSQSEIATHFIIRQYAVLLLSSVLIALIFALRPVPDRTSKRVAGSLAIYHLAPLARAAWRIWGGGRDVVFGELHEGVSGGGLGGPWVHGVVHAVAFIGLGMAFLGIGEVNLKKNVRDKEE